MQENDQLIIFLVIVFTCCLVTLGVFFFILINKYYNSLKKKQAEALNNLIIGQDNERTRIARDLHDEMGPELSSIIFLIDKINLIDEKEILLKEKAKTKLKDSIRRIRQISHNLMPLSLKRYSLVRAIEEMIESNEQEGIEVHFESSVSGTEISDHISSSMYKIFQEMFHNSQKHSKATKINIQLKLDLERKELKYTYSDDGIGFDQNDDFFKGIGLKNINTRVGLMNGISTINGNNGFNAAITIKLD